MAICSICKETNKKSKAYIYCWKHQGLVCDEHCIECEHLNVSMGTWHCTYGLKKRKEKTHLQK